MLHDIKAHALAIGVFFFASHVQVPLSSPSPTPALIASSYGLIHAIDSSELFPKVTYVKAFGEGFSKAIIPGYEEACSVGGEVDPNFVQSYKNALPAGYTNIDMYWFSCNGSRNKFKSYADQLSEIEVTFNKNSMNIGTIWIDFEKDSAICYNVSITDPLNFSIDWNTCD